MSIFAYANFAYANTIDSLQAFGDWKSAISSAFKVTPLHAAECKLKHGHTANPHQFLVLMRKDSPIHAYPQSSQKSCHSTLVETFHKYTLFSPHL